MNTVTEEEYMVLKERFSNQEGIIIYDSKDNNVLVIVGDTYVYIYKNSPFLSDPSYGFDPIHGWDSLQTKFLEQEQYYWLANDISFMTEYKAIDIEHSDRTIKSVLIETLDGRFLSVGKDYLFVFEWDKPIVEFADNVDLFTGKAKPYVIDDEGTVILLKSGCYLNQFVQTYMRNNPHDVYAMGYGKWQNLDVLQVFKSKYSIWFWD